MQRSLFHDLSCVWAAATIATSGCHRGPAVTAVPTKPCAGASPLPAPAPATAPTLAAPTGRPTIASVPPTREGKLTLDLPAARALLVSVEVQSTTRRYAVGVVDPLPAGLESVNTSLATAERAAAVTTDTAWDYQSLRDNRSEAFRMQRLEGTHRFSYTARATTPGVFVAAPAKAEEMYSPETSGRSTGTTVVVE